MTQQGGDVVAASLKERVRAGEVLFGFPVMEFATPGLMAILDAAGADFALLDMEHGCFGIDTIRTTVATARGLGVVPLVRVPYARYEYISRVLDVGARGIMVPRVETPEEMDDVSAAAHYPPLGIRGAAYGIAHDDYRRGDPVEKMETANEQVLVIAMIESAEGLANVDRIGAHPGVDVLWVGHFDLSASLGIPGRIDHPDMVAAFEAVRDAATVNGKIAGRGVMTPEAAMTWVDRGYRMFTYSRDIELLRSHLAHELTQCRDGLGLRKEQRMPGADVATLRERVEVATAEFDKLDLLSPGHLGPPDPTTGEQWGPGNVLGHMSEILPFWTGEIRRALGGAEWIGRGDDGYDVRRRAIDVGPGRDRDELRVAVLDGIDGVRSLLADLCDEDLDRPIEHRRAVGIEQKTIGDAVDDVLVRHLESHVRQLSEVL